MNKYWSVYCLSLQQELYYRASFLMDRARSITILIAFYSFWSAIFQGRDEFIGFTKSQMLTYVLGMNILRAAIFSDTTWELIREINTGKISSYLIRPVSYLGYCLSRDMADKTVNFVSAILEISAAIWLFKITLYTPQNILTLTMFSVSILFAMLLYFFMSYTISSLAFWTAESGGPRFCFELLLEFMAGAFFPLNVLPPTLQNIFRMLPFAGLIHFPLNVYLEKFTLPQYMEGLAIQIFWTAVMGLIAKRVWTRGLMSYTAEGG